MRNHRSAKLQLLTLVGLGLVALLSSACQFPYGPWYKGMQLPPEEYLERRNPQYFPEAERVEPGEAKPLSVKDER